MNDDQEETLSQRPDAKITLEELRGLQEGESYRVTLIDHESVMPESRGKSFDIRFEKLTPNTLLDVIDLDDPACLMVVGHDRTPGSSEIYYGFHGWLIEEIKALAVT